ncbi:MAG: hypothetical protein ACK5Z2_08025 [Bacteroidota bacterium]|jgi:hypothetical protein
MKFLKSLKENPLFPIILSAGIIGISFYVGKMADIINFEKDWKTLLGCTFSIIFVFGLFIYLIHKDYVSEFEIIKSKYDSELKFQVNKLESIVDNYKPSFDWLLTENQLFAFELNFGLINKNQSKQIWIITSSLKNDIDGGFFEELLEENINNGIEYKYIVLTNDWDSQRRCKLFQKKYDYIKVITLEQSKFFSITFADLAIYDPFGNINKRKAFMELPNGGDNFWVEIDQTTTTMLITQIKSQVPEIVQ